MPTVRVLRGHTGKTLKFQGGTYQKGDLLETERFPQVVDRTWDLLRSQRLVEEIDRAGGPSKYARKMGFVVGEKGPEAVVKAAPARAARSCACGNEITKNPGPGRYPKSCEDCRNKE